MRWSVKGKSEVVAPISAPMLQIVALPVHESDSTVLDNSTGSTPDSEDTGDLEAVM